MNNPYESTFVDEDDRIILTQICNKWARIIAPHFSSHLFDNVNNIIKIMDVYTDKDKYSENTEYR
mgnify:CR=1 FL=1